MHGAQGLHGVQHFEYVNDLSVGETDSCVRPRAADISTRRGSVNIVVFMPVSSLANADRPAEKPT